MAQQSFNIGQIIYILSNKNQSVVPAIVAEEDTRKVRKLDGVHEVVNYKLCIGPKDRQRFVDLNRIDGEVFSSLDEIRNTLVERLTSFVDDLVKNTQTNVQNWYGVTADNQVLESSDPSSPDEKKFDPEQLIQSVNHNIPLQQPQQGMHPLQLQQQPQLNPYNSMRDNIRAMVSGENDMMMDPGGPAQVVLPDGKIVKVNGLG